MNRPLLILLMLISLLFSAFTFEYQGITTSLRVTVRDNVGNLVENARVTLYASEDDYSGKVNPVGETVATNKKGEARFRDLNPVSYFVDVRNDELDNEDGGVKIKRLDKNKVNKVTIIIQ